MSRNVCSLRRQDCAQHEGPPCQEWGFDKDRGSLEWKCQAGGDQKLKGSDIGVEGGHLDYKLHLRGSFSCFFKKIFLYYLSFLAEGIIIKHCLLEAFRGFFFTPVAVLHLHQSMLIFH